MMEFDLIITIVNRGFSELVMDAARGVGASGGTILHARGTGVHEAEKFFGISIQPEKELVLILTAHDERQTIMQAIAEKAGLNTPGKGLAFSVPVDDVVGTAALLQKKNGKKE